jgi:hypothetical protein
MTYYRRPIGLCVLTDPERTVRLTLDRPLEVWIVVHNGPVCSVLSGLDHALVLWSGTRHCRVGPYYRGRPYYRSSQRYVVCRPSTRRVLDRPSARSSVGFGETSQAWSFGEPGPSEATHQNQCSVSLSYCPRVRSDLSEWWYRRVRSVAGRA